MSQILGVFKRRREAYWGIRRPTKRRKQQRRWAFSNSPFIELVSPAGNLEKLMVAFTYGADAVYCGIKGFSLRNRSDNFTVDELAEGVRYAHQRGKKVYAALNIFCSDGDFNELTMILSALSQMRVDAVIVSDPGLFMMIKKQFPDLSVHISTQANVGNRFAARFWAEQGAQRIILARELSLDQMRAIIDERVVATEIFIHGALCMAYSGRCHLSTYLSGRQANRGECNQPCRWQYRLVERDNQDIVLIGEEYDTYTAFLNSKDLCGIELLPQIMALGINAIKIEGRMKTAYYVGVVTRIYREALNALYQEGGGFALREIWKKELMNLDHRDYTTGFYTGNKTESLTQYGQAIKSAYQFCGIITQILDDTHSIINVRSPLCLGETLMLFAPQTPDDQSICIKSIIYQERFITKAPVGEDVIIESCQKLPLYGLLRKERSAV